MPNLDKDRCVRATVVANAALPLISAYEGVKRCPDSAAQRYQAVAADFFISRNLLAAVARLLRQQGKLPADFDYRVVR